MDTVTRSSALGWPFRPLSSHVTLSLARPSFVRGYLKQAMESDAADKYKLRFESPMAVRVSFQHFTAFDELCLAAGAAIGQAHAPSGDPSALRTYSF